MLSFASLIKLENIGPHEHACQTFIFRSPWVEPINDCSEGLRLRYIDSWMWTVMACRLKLSSIQKVWKRYPSEEHLYRSIIWNSEIERASCKFKDASSRNVSLWTRELFWHSGKYQKISWQSRKYRKISWRSRKYRKISWQARKYRTNYLTLWRSF